MSTITIGTDVRHWVTFDVKNLTADEIATLLADTEDSHQLLRNMAADGRLEYLFEDSDDNPDYLSDASELSIIEVEVD